MKKLLMVAVTLILLAGNFSVASAAPWDNPNGSWVYDISCGDLGTFDVWVPNNHSSASFNSHGQVGITKALYIDFGQGYELVWGIPGNGVFKNTVRCEWVFDGVHVAGDILVP